MPIGRNISGDMVLTTSNKLICTYGSSSGNYLTQHDYNTGDIEVDILLDTDIYGPYGIFTLLGEIYVCNGDGKIYNLSTSEPYTLNYIKTAPNGIYGSSQSPECSTVTFDYCSPTYYICNTDIPGADDSYLNAGTYNNRQYYSGETDGWVIYFYTGTTSSYWCLSDTLGGSCYLTGKSPCTSECPDLCDDYLSVKPCCPNNLVVNGQFTSNLDGWDISLPVNWYWNSSFNGSALYDGADVGSTIYQDILTLGNTYNVTVDFNLGVSTCTTISIFAGTNEYTSFLTVGDSSIDISLICVGDTIFKIYVISPCETGDELNIINVCVTDITPVIDCDVLDFTALFNCEYMPTPTPTPTSTPTPTPTPSTASNYCSTVGVDAVATINQSTPTPTPTPTPTSTPSIVRDCSFSGDVVWNITQGNILCPFNQQFQDCVNDDMYYVNIVTGLNITPSNGEVFKAIVNGVSKCISYVGIDFNNSPSGTIEITNGPFGSLEIGCENCKIFIPPSPTPTPTMTMTPTPTNSTPPTLCFEYIGDGPNILYQCSVQAQPTLYNGRYYWSLNGCPTAPAPEFGFLECPPIENVNYIWWDNFEWNHSSSLGGGTLFSKLSNPGLLPIEILGTYEWVYEMVGTCAPEIRNSFSGPCVSTTLTPTPTPTMTPTPTNGCDITSPLVLSQGNTAEDACNRFGNPANRATYYTSNYGATFPAAVFLNLTNICTQPASSGWYSDGDISREYNSSTGNFDSPEPCV